MVGAIMASSSYSRGKLQGLARSAKSATDLPPKLHRLRNLRRNLQGEASVFPAELLPLLFDLLSDQFGAARKFVAEILGEIGLNDVELLPEIVPLFIKSLQDDTPAVVRQVIASASALFPSTLHKFALQGLHSSELDELLQSSWTWMLKFKDEICSLAFKQGNSGVKLCAIKFVQALILLYTPDPSVSLESQDFNISILRGGHPVLNIGDLSIEASQKLASLLDQLRHPAAKSLNSSTIIFLINSLSSVAKKRPAYCGRILPVLLSLDAPSFLKGVHAAAANLALKTVFLSCLECTHPAAAPWKDRLIGALKEIEGGSRAEKAEDLFYATNGSIQDKDCVEDTKVSVEQNSLRANSVVAESNFGRKRSGSEYNIDLNGDALTGKRSRITPSVSGESTEGLNGNSVGSLPLVTSTSTGPSNSRGVSDTGPVQQLVAMFGALVAQGEKAIGSLEILISSISADLLADVVMANMHNILLNSSSYADGTDELVMNMSIVGSDAQIKYPPSFVAGVLSLSTAFPPVAALINPHTPKTENEGEELCVHHVDQPIFPSVDAVLASGLSASSVNEEGNIELPPNVDYRGNIESGIPGLDSSAQRYVLSEAPFTSVLGSTNVEAASKNQDTSASGELLLAVIPSVSVDKSEEFSPKATGIGSYSLVSSTATSLASAPQFVLPKISAPVVNLSDEEKDSLQKLVFLRIVEAYKQVSMSGGSQLRFSLLAHLGVEFPSELDPWKMLQEHILSDYLSHEGHELTVRVLYRLYGEAEAEQDFFSSTTAASAYESFLVAVAEALRDSFPPSDKSLSKLLGDSPFLPKSVLKLLESFCCPESGDKVEKDLPSGDRVTQGLSAVWSLILTRPGIRNDCLKIALQSAVHPLEEIRMKAIRLVANKLYSLSFITQQIEEFAKDKLFSVVSCISSERGGPETLSNDCVKPVSGAGMDSSLEATSVTEAQRCLSLYFALCTKKHALFVHVFSIYKDASDPVKQAIHRQIPILVRTMGSSSELLKIIADPPNGSENLLMQVLQTLTEAAKPSLELIHTIRKLFDTRIKDVEIIFPILPFMPRDDVLRVFPHMVSLPMEKFQVALSRVLQGPSQSGPVLSPSEVLIAIHSIDPARDGIPLKQITDACNTCFAQRQTFTQQVLAGVLNQLVQQIPLPMLFMRTVLQAIGAFPALSDFIMEILSRLVSKQIWKYPKLWVGFLKCAQSTQPQSYKVLLQLPPTQLGNALTKISSLRAPLAAHASQPDIQSSLPRSTLAVLGLVPDSQGTQTSQVQASETQESQVQASETQESQVQASETQESQVQASETQESQVQASETQESQMQASETQEGQGKQQASESQEQTSPSQQVSVPLSHSETDHNQETSQVVASHSQSSPIATGRSETSQSQSSPIGAGQSEVSQTTQVSDSDPPLAPTSHTQTSDSQPDNEKMEEDTATSENERSEVDKSKESSAEEEEEE
ncbi:PREDICTED: symplekin isoform X2 [Brassica oleracea var. oleracea]|uniref:Symplekin C-terminal domain-containing protein n=1 Tax=Brassica oleracea var. oleracea TaxID=109376 RepID=A0A0D3AHD9_BRAOL|nr:PREDICTED: symplekin isoform X2 [Brassica oleracea var. oleracea]